MAQQPPAMPETEDGRNLNHVLLFYRENGIPAPIHHPYPMPDLDIGDLKHVLTYPRDSAIVQAPMPIDVTTEMQKTTLITLHKVADQLYDTWEQFKKHRSCRVPIVRNDLIGRFVQSVRWQHDEVLEVPLLRLQNDVGSMTNEELAEEPVVGYTNNSLKTYASIFADTQIIMKALVRQVDFFMQLRGIEIDPKHVQTRCPRDILLEIALWNKIGHPSLERLKAISIRASRNRFEEQSRLTSECRGCPSRSRP